MNEDEEELQKRKAEEERLRKQEHDRQFEELYAYLPGVVSLLKQLGFPHEEARELAQDVFVRVYQGIKEFRGEAKWSYLQQVARRLAMNWFRDRHAAKREGQNVSDDELNKQPSDATQQPDALLERQEVRKRLYQAVVQLDDKQRTCLLLRLAGFSYLEISEILGISQSALKSRINAAQNRLKQILGEEALGWDDGQ